VCERRKGNDRIRVTAQLIEVGTDTHLWSETYTRELDDIFAVQDEIANAIVTALKVTLASEDEAPIHSQATISVDAYNKFLMGRHLWNQRSPKSLLAATTPLKEAVAIDPAYADAWAALADAYVLIPEYNAGSIQKFIPLAQDAIDKALKINPASAHALSTSAYTKFMYAYDFKGAHADFSRAIEIDPAYATAHQWYGELLAVERKIDAALKELELARQLDPLSPIIPHVMGWILTDTTRREEAYQYYQDALDLDPYFQSTIGNLVTLNMMTGRFDSARERCLELSRLVGFDPTSELAIINALDNPKLTELTLEQLMQDNSYPGGAGKAQALMLLNQPELAMSELEKSFSEGDSYAVHVNRMESFDSLRDKPRFQAFLAKMNLWP